MWKKLFLNLHMKYSTLLFRGWNYLQVGSMFFFFFLFISSHHLWEAKQSPELHVHTRMSALVDDLLRQEEQISIRVLGNTRVLTWCVGGGYMDAGQTQFSDFSASRTSSLTSNKRFCTFQWGKCSLQVDGCTCWFAELLRRQTKPWLKKTKQKKRAADCLWIIQLTRHMMVFSFLHIGIFKGKEHARNKYPHTLSTWTTEQISHLQTFCFCVRLFKILTSVLYDCKHWKKVILLALKHRWALHSVFKFL